MKIRHVAVGSLALVLAAFGCSSVDLEGPGAAYCEAHCDCEDCNDKSREECADNIADISDEADETGCDFAFDTYLDCLEKIECDDGNFDTDDCEGQKAELDQCMKPKPTCPTTGDGVCDEPEGSGKCAEGTDAVDCGPPTCATVNDGSCDEPEGTDTCAEGTDTADCGAPTCDSTDNGVCDEPEGTGLCPEGTDVNDCDVPTCQSINNGECDEPEGTGLCPEGTDINDCDVPPCIYTNNGECDEPEGSGLCAEGTDINDCS